MLCLGSLPPIPSPQVDLGRVSNKSGFLSSIIKRVDMERIANANAAAHRLPVQQQGYGGAPHGGHFGTAGGSAPGGYGGAMAPLAGAYRPGGGGGGGALDAGGAAGLATLDPSVARKARDLVARGVMTIDDFDARVCAGLRELGPHTGGVAVDRLGTSHMNDIRSRASFFMGT